MQVNESASSVKVDFCTDSLLPKRNVTLGYALVNKLGRMELKLGDEVLEFPVDWLRHNCQCTKCFSPACLAYIAPARPVVFGDFKLVSVEARKSSNSVICTYSDDHESEFKATWLFNRRMTEKGNKERTECISPGNAVPWADKEDMVVQRGSYEEVTETAAGFERFAEALITDGLFIIGGTPDRYVSEEFGEKTGLVPIVNHYGRNWFVKNIPTPVNFAYTPVELELHVDQTYLISCPQIQLLHCLIQSDTGGENVLVDGIKAANILRVTNPKYFQTLITIKLRAEDLNALSDQPQFYMSNAQPLIQLNEKGEPALISWSNPSHSSFFAGSPDEYEEFMAAFKEFFKILYDNAIHNKAKPGDILVFDNKRVMHGRLAYDGTQERELEGWYIEWDTLYSKLRVTKIRNAQANQ